MELTQGPDGSVIIGTMADNRSKRASGPRKKKRSNDRRTECEVDVDRLLYSRYLRRMAGVSQIVTPTLDAKQTHSRLTHSLKVSNLAGEIAKDLCRALWVGPSEASRKNSELFRRFGGLDIGACVAAGLAHDMGHAPFGHVAEKWLDNWMTQAGGEGFEGNPQSFRTITMLDQRKTGDVLFGLDLTAVSLCATVKYPWTRNESLAPSAHESRKPRFDSNAALNTPPKYACYSSESEIYEFCRLAVPKELRDLHAPSVEACVMDIADDVTYAFHDFQDFLELGIISISDINDQIVEGFSALQAGKAFLYENNSPNEFARCAAYLDITERRWNIDNYLRALHTTQTWLASFREALKAPPGSLARASSIRSLISRKIGLILDEIELTDEELESADAEFRAPSRVVRLKSNAWHEVQILKWIAVAHIIGTPGVTIHEQSQLAALKSVVQGFMDMVTTTSARSSLPSPLREYLSAAEDFDDSPIVRRAIVDYLCVLTDNSCLELSKYFSGLEVPDFRYF